MTKVCVMQSQVPAADRHLPCDTERPESIARVQQENPIDHIMLTLWCGWNAFLDSRQPGAAASPFKPRLMLGFWLALAAMWAIVGTVTLCVRTDWHSLTHQPEMVGKAFVHDFTVQVAYVWSTYKSHHRLRHLLPEIYGVLKLACLVLPSTLVLHVLPLLRDVWTATTFAVSFPLWGALLRNLFSGNKRNAEYLAVFLVYFFVYLNVAA